MPLWYSRTYWRVSNFKLQSILNCKNSAFKSTRVLLTIQILEVEVFAQILLCFHLDHLLHYQHQQQLALVLTSQFNLSLDIRATSPFPWNCWTPCQSLELIYPQIVISQQWLLKTAVYQNITLHNQKLDQCQVKTLKKTTVILHQIHHCQV